MSTSLTGDGPGIAELIQRLDAPTASNAFTPPPISSVWANRAATWRAP